MTTKLSRRRRGATVLWGGRRGDVHYNSREFWRRNIPIDPSVSRVTVENAAYFDVGSYLQLGGWGPSARTHAFGVVRGIEDRDLGLEFKAAA